MKRILIAPNSFKECAYSTEAALLIYNSFKKLVSINPEEIELVQFPISDGGDGFLNVIKAHFNTSTRHYNIKSFLNGNLIACPVEYSEEKKTIFIESAKVVGLNLIPVENRNPLTVNTAPMGELLKEINKEAACGVIDLHEVVIGIGGTAANDLGMGMLSEFGLKLFDSSGNELLPVPENFNCTASIINSAIEFKFKIKTVLDVENPLIGEKGATRVFSPQKGADEKVVILMEKGFENLLKLLNITSGRIGALSGAGGGLAAAFQLFFNAEKIFARDFILNDLGLASKNFNFQMVITGEGVLDDQTFLNKGAKVVVDYFRDKNCKIFFICGENKLYREPEFLNIIELTKYFKNSSESIEKFPEGIFKACRSIINNYSI